VRVSDQNEVEGIPLVPDPSAARLDERHQQDYRAHRSQLVQWLLAFGKDPGTAEGYAHRTVLNTVQRLDIFYRWAWETRRIHDQHQPRRR
jgi:hypothetical protein